MTDPQEHRKTAARMANQAREAGEPSGWFEPFYQWATQQEAKVPWADLAPHELLLPWLDGRSLGAVAVVGCGLGDDAEAIAPQAETVWAFDVSPTAIEWARRRFPESKVSYEVANVYSLDESRMGKFDAVVEIYTIQALPPESRGEAWQNICGLAAPGGELVVITRWRRPEDALGAVPWPLLLSELDSLAQFGMEEVSRTESEPGQAIRSVWRRGDQPGAMERMEQL